MAKEIRLKSTRLEVLNNADAFEAFLKRGIESSVSGAPRGIWRNKWKHKR